MSRRWSRLVTRITAPPGLKATALVVVLILWVGIGAIAISYHVPPARFPAFNMTYEITHDAGISTNGYQHIGTTTRIYHLIYEHDDRWKEAWVRTITTTDTGTTTRTAPTLVYEHSWPSADGTHVPGRWFWTEQQFIGRGRIARGAVWTQEQVGAEHVVTITRVSRAKFETEMRFDAATGIPVIFEERVWGRVVWRLAVTSLVLADGRRIR